MTIRVGVVLSAWKSVIGSGCLLSKSAKSSFVRPSTALPFRPVTLTWIVMCSAFDEAGAWADIDASGTIGSASRSEPMRHSRRINLVGPFTFGAETQTVSHDQCAAAAGVLTDAVVVAAGGAAGGGRTRTATRGK